MSPAARDVRRRWVFAAVTFLVCWLLLVLTTPGMPLVWDEGEYLFRAQRIIDWFRLRPLDLSHEGIRAYWLFIYYAEGHPAGFALPIALGKWLASPFIHTLTAARLGPITLFSAACAVVAARLKKDHGTGAAIVAVSALLTFPRVFSEAHFATQDGQLTSWWLLLWAVQAASTQEMRVTLTSGIVLGLATATKFTGWLAWGPTIVSQAIKGRASAYRLIVILPIALLTFYVVNPPLWHAPIEGLSEHFHRSLDRANTFNIPTLFLGRIYSVQTPLPWYNTLTWLFFVTPVPTLLLGVIGVWHCVAKRTPASLSLLLHWSTLMIVRALPGAPPHDGIRLFLPAFGLWCVLAGIGGQRVLNAISSLQRASWRYALRAAVALAIAASGVSVVRYYPQTLSHYSGLVGGLHGATDKGMEPAYWWDALDADVLAWLNRNTPDGEVIAFSSIAPGVVLREWGRLVPKDVDPQEAAFKWYVLQNRPGMFTRVDRTLMRRETPAFVKFAGRRPAGAPVPRDLNVPLISVFSYEQYQRASRPRGRR